MTIATKIKRKFCKHVWRERWLIMLEDPDIKLLNKCEKCGKSIMYSVEEVATTHVDLRRIG